MEMGELVEPAQPLCPYFRKCGGCTTQHVPYQLQLENKQNRIIALLKKNKLSVPASLPMYADDPYFYRNRMDFLFTKQGIGLRSSENPGIIIPIGRCVISNARINELLQQVQAWFLSCVHEVELKTLKEVIIRSAEHTASSAVVFLLDQESSTLAHHTDLLRQFARQTTADKVAVGMVSSDDDALGITDSYALKGSTVMEEQLYGNKILFSAYSFFQNNTEVAEAMVKHCTSVLQQYQTQQAALLDVYGGAGTFGICLAELFKRTLIIDTEGPNIRCAEENIKNNGLENIQAVRGDAAVLGKIIAKAGISGELFVITDPPRTGMGQKAIKVVLGIRPAVILYVSCNPVQLAKELRRFTKNYVVVSLAIFDMFPQTNHIETIVELRRIS